MSDRVEVRTRESKVEKEVCEYAVRRGWMVVKLMLCSITGMPDRLLMRRGVVIFIELKAPLEGPTKLQAKRHRDIREHGVEVYVASDLSDVLEVLT